MEFSIIVDIIIILMILLGGIQGFKNGAIKTSMRFIGLFIVIIISFILKDRLMVFLYENLPFFDFFGLIKGIDSINILLYQLISFIVVFSLLMLVLRVLVALTGIVEWLLKKMIFIGVPSKILGSIIGCVEYYVYAFIVLYILNVPIFGLTFIDDSTLGTFILDKTPVLSELVDDTVKVYSDVWNVIRNRGDLSGQEINTFVLATLLDNDLITISSARELVRSNYITIKDNSILDKYKGDDNFFETIGGCLLLGGCEGDSSAIDRIYTTNISNDGEVFTVEDMKFRIAYIGFNNCIGKGICDKNERIEVGLVVDNGYEELEMKLITGDRYKWILDTDNYALAFIENGKLSISIAEYNGRWNNYDN